MAGITGFVIQNNHGSSDMNKQITNMAKGISYTGSEHIDQWNDRYLAISRVHHGNLNVDPQPIFNEDESLCIVMDGEVYDYQLQRRKLIDKGHHFSFGKENDAEYCLHAFEEYGLDAFPHFNGSFLIALYNLETNKLLLVNDRFSSRPLFYYYDKNKIVFGTQLRSLLEYPNLPRRLDFQAIFEFFTFQRVLGERTYYKDFKVLSPGSIVHFQNNEISFHKYWTMQYSDKFQSEDYYVEELHSRLKEAIKRRTSSKNRYSILLSGGLDSRVVLAACERKPIAYTLGDYKNNEVNIAQKVALQKGCKHVFLRRDRNYYPDLIDEAVDIGDGMYRFDHAHFLGFLSKIREESDIVLHGHGLDYTFQGLYLPLARFNILGKTVSYPTLAKIDRSNLSKTLLETFNYSLYDAPEEIFQAIYSKQYKKNINDSVQGIVENYDLDGVNKFNIWDYFVLHSIFKHFTFLNFLCVRAYINERTILFDNDLFDLYLSMPPELRLGGRVFRKALGRIAPELSKIPNSNTHLRADIPLFLEWLISVGKGAIRELSFKSQHHASPPHYSNSSWPKMSELIRSNDMLKALIYNTIHDKESIDPKIFDVKKIEIIFEKHLMGEKDFVDQLFLLLTFGRWYKKYGP